jgi:hypothetical protein
MGKEIAFSRLTRSLAIQGAHLRRAGQGGKCLVFLVMASVYKIFMKSFSLEC